MSGSQQPPTTGATGDVGLLPQPVFTPPAAGQTVLTVGQGQEFSTLAAAIAASQNGDLIEVQAGTYTNDFSIAWSQVTIEGVGGMVDLVATEPPPDDKAILTTNASMTIENVAFSGAAVPDSDGGNGAGIRYQGGDLTLINDKFEGNQDGILANADPTGTITIDHSLFENNGVSDPNMVGYGATHNMYINGVGQFTLENSISEAANVGHEVKSRALNTTIVNNWIGDGSNGTSSYEIDLPNGGNAVVENNTIEKGPGAQNNFMVHFCGESDVIPYADSSLTVSGNTFVNDYGPSGTMLLNGSIYTVTVDGNTFDNFGTSESEFGAGPAVYTNNWSGNGTEYPNSSSTGIGPGSNTVYFNDNLPHDYTITQSGIGVVGGGGLLTLDDQAGHVTVEGGTGGIDFTEEPGAGGSDIITHAGAQDTVNVVGEDDIQSQGDDLITTGQGDVIAAISGNATVQAGTADNSWAVSGQAVINVNASPGVGSDTVSVLSGAMVSVTGAGQYLEVDNYGGTSDAAFTQDGALLGETVVGGASTTQMYDNTMVLDTSNGGPGSNVTFGSGNVLMDSAGADTVHAGSGNETIIVSGSAQIFEGSGGLSVYGSGSPGATVYGGSGTTYLGGDSGNIDYVGGASHAAVQLNLSGNTIQGGAGRLSISGAGSDETIEGGSGGIDYTTEDGGDTVTTEAGATDAITIGTGSWVDSNGNDQISLGQGSFQVTVTGASSVQGSTGNSNYTISGNDTVSLRGNDQLFVTPGGKAVVSDSGSATYFMETDGLLNFTGASAGDDDTATVSGGNASLSYNAGQGGIRIGDSTGGAMIELGAGWAGLSVAGNDTVAFGAGDATVGYGGSDRTFIFSAHSAPTNTLFDQFVVGQDQLEFQRVSVTAEATGDGGTTLTLSDGSTIGFVDLYNPPNWVGQGDPQGETLTTSGNTINGTDIPLTITDEAGHNTINGGSGGLTLVALAPGDVITTASGARDQLTLDMGGRVTSSGDDTITAGGATSVTVMPGGNVALASTGSFHLTETEAQASVSDQNGAEALQVWGGSASVAGSSANAGLNVQAGVDSPTEEGPFIYATAGTAAVHLVGAAGTGATVAGAAGTILHVNSGDSNAVIVMDSGWVHGGTGTDIISAINAATVVAGSGYMLFAGGSGPTDLHAGSGFLLGAAGSGNTTLIGGTGNLSFTTGSGNDLVRAGAGANAISFGSGNSTVDGGAAQDLYSFVFGQGGGMDLITHFKVGTDQIVLHGFSQAPTETVSSGSLHLGLSDGTQIVVAGVTHLASSSVVMS